MNLEQAAFDYSIRIAELVKHLRSDGKGFPLCDELLQCGVDAGLCLREPHDAKRAAACLNRADYLLEMAAVAGYLTERQTGRIRESGQKLIQILNKNEEGGRAK
jgi:hypothetical protein